ncbi:hypothetical protein BKA70DRAFT_1430089 [Coprinopsis sp. MPI-PUGE-AT-0042]|nr:hypothetical protein BKA70DRAFT_1430089 [Coprinopsis sp. MPI-PUGE-AT-0042]
MIPQVPPEIAFHTIDCLGGDDVSLKNASLVCQAWQYHSQQRLFRTLSLTVYPEGSTIRRLEDLGSSVRIRAYVDCLVMRYYSQDVTNAWLDTHGERFAQAVRMLPLATLSRFVLVGDWIRYGFINGIMQTPSPEALRCIQDICAGPMLTTLSIWGRTPFLPLLSRCGPSLKELYTSKLPADCVNQDLSPLGREVAINLEVLHMNSNDSAPTPSHPISFYDYLLDPRALLSLKSLRFLEASGVNCFDQKLSRILAACAASVEDLEVTFVEPPPKGCRLAPQNAPELKRPRFYMIDLAGVSVLLELIEWPLLPISPNNCNDKRLSNITLELPADCLVDDIGD